MGGRDVGNGRRFQYWHIVAAVTGRRRCEARTDSARQDQGGLRARPLLRDQGRPRREPTASRRTGPLQGHDRAAGRIDHAAWDINRASARPELRPREGADGRRGVRQRRACESLALEQHAGLSGQDRLADPAHHWAGGRPDARGGGRSVHDSPSRPLLGVLRPRDVPELLGLRQALLVRRAGPLPVQAREDTVRHAKPPRRRLRAGLTASDIAGNAGTSSLRFTVENEPELRS